MVISNDLYECSWNVLPNYGLSDHSVILIELKKIGDDLPHNSQFSVPKWFLKDVDWTNYTDALRSKINNIHLNQFLDLEVNEQVIFVNECVTSTNDECMRKIYGIKSPKVVWWPNKLRDKRTHVRNLFRVYIRVKNRLNANLNEIVRCKRAHKLATKEYKTLIRNTKLENWKTIVTERSGVPWGQVYKICRGKMDRTPLSSLIYEFNYLE